MICSRNTQKSTPDEHFDLLTLWWESHLKFRRGWSRRGLSRSRCVDQDPEGETADQHVTSDDSKLIHRDDRASSPSSQIPDRKDNFGRERRAIGGDVYHLYRTVSPRASS